MQLVNPDLVLDLMTTAKITEDILGKLEYGLHIKLFFLDVELIGCDIGLLVI